MKKLFFGLLAMVMFGFVGNAKQLHEPIKLHGNHISPERATLVIHLEFGRVSQNCRGFGICDFDADILITRGPFTGGADSNGNLVLYINAEGIKKIISYFGSEKIVLEENYTLDDKACKDLGLRSGYTIRTGTYRLVPQDKSAGTFTVTF
jgi:hypothetical protein